MTLSRVPRLRDATARRQYGFGGVLILALIASMTAAAGLFAFYRADEVQFQRERASESALSAAKEALINYAVSRGGASGNARPGELPCPDTDPPGSPGYGLENTPCRTGATLIGRLPWRTLGIPEPRDAAGEPLWYALSPSFRQWDSFPLGTPSSARRINSDSRGQLIVRGPDGVNALVTDAVAVIFAPGAPLGAQNRANGGPAVHCALTGTLSVPVTCPTNFLEGALGTENAVSASGPFIAAQPTDRFNDRLLYLTAAELMPAVEMRVGAELRNLLIAYRQNSSCQCYPWADNWPYSGGIADVGQSRGRFPSLPYPESWGQAGIPALPPWVSANDWHNFFWYSVGRQNANQSQVCRTCSDLPMLRVGDQWVSALLFAPGPPLDGIARLNPPAGQLARRDNLALYLEDPQNNDGASAQCPDVGEIGGPMEVSGLRTGAASCDTYVVPTARTANRDRIFLVGVTPPGVCATEASTLLNNVTCHSGGSAVKPACEAAVRNLDACPCLQAARTMVEPPCRNTTSPPQCQAAISTLQTCR